MKVYQALSFVAAALLINTAAFAADPALADIHAKKGVNCEQCHTQGTAVAPTSANCQACHGPYSSVAEKTAQLVPNPHASHMGELDCVICHKGHGAQTVYCNECHTFKSLKLN